MANAPERLVLVVDDVEQMTSTVAEFLERRIVGVKVVARQKPREALAWLRENGARVHLILSDNHMAEMDGLTFLTQSRALAPDAVRALMTAYLDLEITPQQLGARGVHGVIRKPWEWAEFGRFAFEMMAMPPAERARTEAMGPVAYPKGALDDLAKPKPAPAPRPPEPLVRRAPLVPERLPCPTCHEHALGALPDDEEARRILALLRSRPGIAAHIQALQTMRR